jgi:hypothetical protein
MCPGRNVRRGSETSLTFASKIALQRLLALDAHIIEFRRASRKLEALQGARDVTDVELHHMGLASEVAP